MRKLRLAGERLVTRAAVAGDAPVVARIYNEGIADRFATFETRPRGADDVRGWLEGSYPVVVAEDEGRVVAWASSFAYSPRACYQHIAEVSVYVAREARGCGAGRRVLEELIRETRAAGLTKLFGKILAANRASRGLFAALGFREIGVHLRHGQLDGVWHDVVLVERLLDES